MVCNVILADITVDEALVHRYVPSSDVCRL